MSSDEVLERILYRETVKHGLWKGSCLITLAVLVGTVAHYEYEKHKNKETQND